MTIVEREVAPEVLTERERRARVLEAAALEIEVRGWVQGDYACEKGVCALGALLLAVGLNPDNGALFSTKEWGPVDNACGESFIDCAWVWNDMPGRTADDVTFVLRWRAEEIRDGR